MRCLAVQYIAFVALIRVPRLLTIVDRENGQKRRNAAVVAVDDERVRRIVIHTDKLVALAQLRKSPWNGG